MIDLIEPESEPEKAEEPDPADEAEEPFPTDEAEELVPEAEEVQAEPSPVKKKRILRAGPRKWKLGPEHLRMPITARRMRQQLLRMARGRRLWHRRNLRRVHRFI